MKKKIAIASFLLLVIAIAAFSRNSGFMRTHRISWDEEAYLNLAKGLSGNPPEYNCLRLVGPIWDKGLHAPGYFKDPLFKHPPLFSYLINFTGRLIEPDFLAGFYVSAFFGMLIIPLAFFAGRLLFDTKTGLIASLLLSIDPILWICSEKIWLETALAAFMWLSLLSVILAIKSDKGSKVYFCLAGVFGGLGLLTKYPAFLIFPIGINLIYIFNKKLLFSRHFWAWPLISFLVFSPWLIWNLRIYGAGSFANFLSAHEIRPVFIMSIASALAVAALALLIIRYLANKVPRLRLLSIAAAMLVLFSGTYVFRGILNSMDFRLVPVSGWESAMFSFQPKTFYIKRLIEFSPFYLLSFAGLLFLGRRGAKELYLFIPVFWTVAFYTLWGNFQARYLLFAVPALLLAASRTMAWSWEKASGPGVARPVRMLLKVSMIAVFLFFLAKTCAVDISIALRNDVAYF